MGDPFVRPGLPYEPSTEQVMLRNHGTFTADCASDEWITAQHRDTLGTLLQRPDMLCMIAASEAVHPGRARRELLERMSQPTRKRDRDPT